MSLLAVLQAGLFTVLRRYTGQDDLTVGSILRAYRADSRRWSASSPTRGVAHQHGGRALLRGAVGRCHHTVHQASLHQDVPFGLVVDAVRPERVAGRNPLFQVSLTCNRPAPARTG